jgi:hypothetical protein
MGFLASFPGTRKPTIDIRFNAVDKQFDTLNIV